ncbi:hypothetical protein ABZU76_14600 [Amycolatopsis sp. NPDC005232]|uniref:hypothetical protein n=1 Tax=Amycolatopsis sp. NPDC005232 TaxID=3157027 RepID=UPI0033AFDF9F
MSLTDARVCRPRPLTIRQKISIDDVRQDDVYLPCPAALPLDAIVDRVTLGNLVTVVGDGAVARWGDTDDRGGEPPRRHREYRGEIVHASCEQHRTSSAAAGRRRNDHHDGDDQGWVVAGAGQTARRNRFRLSPNIRGANPSTH